MLLWVLLLFSPFLLYVRRVYLHYTYKHKAKAYPVSDPFIQTTKFLHVDIILDALSSNRKHELCTHMEGRANASGKLTTLGNSIVGLTVMTIDPENIKAMLSTQFKEFDLGTRYPQLKPLLGDGIFTLSGNGWFHSRAMLRPQFTKDQVTNLAGFEKHVDRLLDIFESSTKNGEVMDVQPYFHSLTLDFSCEFLFGEDIKSLIGGREDLTCDPNEFQVAFDAAQEFVMTRSQLGSFYYLYDSFTFRRDINTCKKFIEMFVHKALKIDGEKLGGRYVFINALAKQTRDPVMLRDQCLNVLLAGRDTTASLLSLSIYLLARHKDVWETLRKDVLDRFGHTRDDITYDGLRSCQYLKNFINEVMRFYSIVPFNFRHCNTDTTLPRGGGPDESEPIFVPKGTTVYYIPYAMHRSPKFWGEDAHMFKPDRWNDKQNSPRHPWAFIPFNGGPRVCIGQQLALAEASYTLVRLIQQFKDISAPSDSINDPFKERTGLILTSGDGVNVSFTRDTEAI